MLHLGVVGKAERLVSEGLVEEYTVARQPLECLVEELVDEPIHSGEVLEVLAVVLELLLFIAVLTSFLSFGVVVV